MQVAPARSSSLHKPRLCPSHTSHQIATPRAHTITPILPAHQCAHHPELPVGKYIPPRTHRSNLTTSTECAQAVSRVRSTLSTIRTRAPHLATASLTLMHPRAAFYTIYRLHVPSSQSRTHNSWRDLRYMTHKQIPPHKARVYSPVVVVAHDHSSDFAASITQCDTTRPCSRPTPHDGSDA
jgi:hypothetical protein